MRVTSFVAVLAATMVAGCAAPVEEILAEPTTATSTAILESWQVARLNITESAELMNEMAPGFQPTDAVRTFSQMLTHIAGANYIFCSAAKGEESPHSEESFEDVVTEPDEIRRVLEESMAYCDAAYEAATDASLAEMIEQPFSGDPGPRAAALICNVGHLNEHYGNLVTYFRVNDLVPPSSR